MAGYPQKGAKLERSVAIYDAKGPWKEIAKQFGVKKRVVESIKRGDYSAVMKVVTDRHYKAPAVKPKSRFYRPFRDGTHDQGMPK